MIKVRQPLQKVMIPVLDANQKAEIEAISDLIKAEVNVKEIELLDDASGILVKQIKPNFKTLGPRFGKDIGLISKYIQEFSPQQISELERLGVINIELSGKNITLALSDVEITSQDIEGWLVANSGNITVALDITISEELKKEGIARELINRIQNLRKDAGFEVTDTIHIRIEAQDDLLKEAIEANADYIKAETLTETIAFDESLPSGTEIEFDDLKTKILISK
jgi:isoleucyl-tRNA synthetase